MSVSPQSISHALVTAIQKAPEQADELVSGCVEFLKENGMIFHKDAILRHLKRMADNERQHNTLRIHTGSEPSQALLNAIKQNMDANDETPVEVRLDKDMLGGVVAEYRGKILDTSIETILTRLTHSLTA